MTIDCPDFFHRTITDDLVAQMASQNGFGLGRVINGSVYLFTPSLNGNFIVFDDDAGSLVAGIGFPVNHVESMSEEETNKVVWQSISVDRQPGLRYWMAWLFMSARLNGKWAGSATWVEFLSMVSTLDPSENWNAFVDDLVRQEDVCLSFSGDSGAFVKLKEAAESSVNALSETMNDFEQWSIDSIEGRMSLLAEAVQMLGFARLAWEQAGSPPGKGGINQSFYTTAQHFYQSNLDFLSYRLNQLKAEMETKDAEQDIADRVRRGRERSESARLTQPRFDQPSRPKTRTSTRKEVQLETPKMVSNSLSAPPTRSGSSPRGNNFMMLAVVSFALIGIGLVLAISMGNSGGTAIPGVLIAILGFALAGFSVFGRR